MGAPLIFKRVELVIPPELFSTCCSRFRSSVLCRMRICCCNLWRFCRILFFFRTNKMSVAVNSPMLFARRTCNVSKKNSAMRMKPNQTVLFLS